MPLEAQLLQCKRDYWEAWIRDQKAEMDVAQGRARNVRAQGAAEPTEEQNQQLLNEVMAEVNRLWQAARLAGDTAEMSRLQAKVNELAALGVAAPDEVIAAGHMAAAGGGTATATFDFAKICAMVSSNEGQCDSCVVLHDGAGLSFGILQWTARYTLREQIIRPNLEQPWFKQGLGSDVYAELLSVLDADTDQFVEWSCRPYVATAFKQLGGTPEMSGYEERLGQARVQGWLDDFARDNRGLLVSERAVAWYADARNQCGSVQWDAIAQAIAFAEAKLGRQLCEGERILIAAKCQAKFLAAAKWESDVFGREAACAIDRLPGGIHRSDYSEYMLRGSPQAYLGQDTLQMELDPWLNYGGNDGLTNRPHPGLRTVFQWSPAEQAYLLSSAELVDNPDQCADPTRGIHFDPPITTSSQGWTTWPARNQ